MISLYKDPEGKYVFDHGTYTAETQENTTVWTKYSPQSRTGSEHSTKIYQLEAKVVELERTLKEYQVSFSYYNISDQI